MKEPEIRCPKCAWKPTAESRWSCTSECGTQWNTFWTAGVCPGCARQWYETQCLACHKRSPHKDWYHFPDDEDQALEARQADRIHA